MVQPGLISGRATLCCLPSRSVRKEMGRSVRLLNLLLSQGDRWPLEWAMEGEAGREGPPIQGLGNVVLGAGSQASSTGKGALRRGHRAVLGWPGLRWHRASHGENQGTPACLILLALHHGDTANGAIQSNIRPKAPLNPGDGWDVLPPGELCVKCSPGQEGEVPVPRCWREGDRACPRIVLGPQARRAKEPCGTP